MAKNSIETPVKNTMFSGSKSIATQEFKGTNRDMKAAPGANTIDSPAPQDFLSGGKKQDDRTAAGPIRK